MKNKEKVKEKPYAQLLDRIMLYTSVFMIMGLSDAAIPIPSTNLAMTITHTLSDAIIAAPDINVNMSPMMINNLLP